MNFRITDYLSPQIKETAKRFSLHEETVALLFSRGISSDEDIRAFLSPGRHRFIDPYKMKGVKEAVERIRFARDEGETVVVYGDYDADGISATAIMYRALTEYGVNAVPFVPERTAGYGLSIENIDYIMEEYLPSLVITVDCGISCAKEVEYLKDLAVDVIVTDHHELPDVLPDCITVNCKIPSDYGFEYLCGAGVAYKIATALLGDRAFKYIDLATIATIADSMPLTGENRDIVYEGVKAIKSGNCHQAVKELIAVANMREVTSTSLAFTIAPRINAAGRMGDAKSALTLAITDDNRLIEELSVKLNSYNTRRQTESEALYLSARQKLISSSFDKKIIILEDDGWNSGLVGIIASKLVEEFSRPVILFVNNDGKLHGSARSIDRVNIFEAISACKEFLTDFGGHAQAAGISVTIENYPAFKKALEDYIDSKYGYECFMPVKTADLLVESPFSIELAKEINLLEPFGTGNKKPVFAIRTSETKAMPIKAGSPHLSIRTEYIDMLYFYGAGNEGMISLPFEKQILFEPNVSVFNREESLKGYVKDIEYVIDPSVETKLCAFRESLLTALNDNDDYLYVSDDMTASLVSAAEREHFGTIFALYNIENLKKYPALEKMERYLHLSAGRNLVNNVVVGFSGNQIKGYRKIVYLDRPLGKVNYVEDMPETFINRTNWAFNYADLDVRKETFADIFRRISKLGRVFVNSTVDFVLKYDLGYKKMQTLFVLEVFMELGFFTITRGALRQVQNAKSPLSMSRIYQEVEKLKS